jgi:hypothetical protein
MTRSMAAVDIAVAEEGEKVFVFGNAPTALFRLLEHDVAVNGVIGVPVGFVGAAESKEALSRAACRASPRWVKAAATWRPPSSTPFVPPAGGAMSEQSFDAPVWHNGKALRKGYTTGSCATAAAKVAALMVMRQHLIHQVSIVTLPASRCALTLSPRTLKGSRRSPPSVKTAAMMLTPPTAC